MPQANRYAPGSPGRYDVNVVYPQHPVAVQGPTDPANLYAILTWDRNNPDATGYRIYRDDEVIATVTDAGGVNDWDKRYYKDTGVTALATHDYQVAPIVAGVEGPQSGKARVTIRRSTAGKTIDVTLQSGATLRDKITNALAAAVAAGPTWLEPAVLYFPAGTHVLATTDSGGTFTLPTHSNIIIRGASETTTIIRASFAGDATSTGTAKNLFRWSGVNTLAGVNPSVAVERGTHTVTLDDASGIAVGDVIALNDMTGSTVKSADHSESYNKWDASIVTAKDGNTLTVREPWAKPFPTTATVLLLNQIGGGIEQCTVEGDSSSTATYYTLLLVDTCAYWHMAEVRGRWCNRNVLWNRGYNPQIVECTITQTDPKALGVGETERYDLSMGRGSRAVIVGNVFGDLDRTCSSQITTQVCQKQVVRHNQFLRSENYGWNSHGAGDFWGIVENNYFYMPECDKGGVFLGNSSFFYAGPTIIRFNTFDTCNVAPIACQQNSWEVRILDNWFKDCPDKLVDWYGSDFSDMPAALYGSARSTVRRNQCTGTQAAQGYVFGYDGGSDPYPGVRDLILEDNEADVVADAVSLGGTSAQSYALQVSGTTGTNSYTRPGLISGDYWADNEDDVAVTGSGSEGSPYFADTFSGTAGTSAGWPIYLRSTSHAQADFNISSSGNYGRLSATSGTAGARKQMCALRSNICHDSFAMSDFRDLSDAVSRRQCLVARHVGSAANDDHYRVLYEYAGSSPRLRLEKVVGGTATVLASTTAFDADLVGDLRVKLELIGTNIRARAWLISGAEPGPWTFDVTDTTITEAGKCGVLNDSPDTLTTICDFDNYKLINWTRNAQADYGSPTAVSWETESFPWELADVEAR